MAAPRNTDDAESRETGKWWHYYGIEKPPALGVRPLIDDSDSQYFWNRQKEITEIRSECTGDDSRSLVVTGQAGDGKTSLLCNAFQGDPAFIRVDVRRAPSLNNLPGALVLEALRHSRGKLTDKMVDNLALEYAKLRTDATSQEYVGGKGPMPFGASREISQSFTQRVTPFRAVEIAFKVLSRLREKVGRLTLLLDECSTHPDFIKDPYSMIAAITNLQLPGDTTLIVAGRPEYFARHWQNSQSVLRQLFDAHQTVGPLFIPGKGESIELLSSRIVMPEGEPRSLFQEDSIDLIEWLSEGNVREFIRNVRQVLIAGSVKAATFPFAPEFCWQVISAKHSELRLSMLGWKIAHYLWYREKPLNSVMERETRITNQAVLREQLGRMRTSGVVESLRSEEKGDIVYRLTNKGKWIYRLSK